MKLIMKICLSFLIAFSLSASFLSSGSEAASSVSISLTSDSASYVIGDELTVWVKVSVSGGTIAVVEGNMEFDATKLSFVSIQMTSDFDANLEQTVSGNKIHLVRGKLGGFSGNATLYGVTFTAIAVGASSFGLPTSTAADSEGKLVAPQLSGLSLTINPEDTGDTVAPPTETPAGGASTPVTSTPSTKKKTTSKTVASAGKLNLSKSSVTFDKTSAIADGTDKICASVTLKNNSNVTMTTIKPEIRLLGGAEASAIALNQSVWNSCLTSSMAGEKLVTLAVNNTTLQDKIVEFLLPPRAAAVESATPEVDAAESLQTELNLKLESVTGSISRVSGADISAQSPINTKDMLKVSGQADPDASLKIYIYSETPVIKEASAGTDGSWSVALDAPLLEGEHRLEVSVTDKYGNESGTKLLTRFEVVKSSSSMLIIIIGIVLLLAAGVFFFLRRRSQGQPPMKPTAPANQNIV